MKKKFWIVNKVNAFTAEILLYGFIGEYEAIDDAAFITDLRTLENTYTNINIRVNCGGGDVYKGLTIFNAIRNSKATICGFVDGIAASMGAVIIAACSNVQMSKYARYMTHRVRGSNFGNADEMRNFATQLDELETTIATIIAKRTGLTVEEAKTKYIVNQDRWISADQALTEKVIDGIYDADPVEIPATENNAHSLFNAYHKVFNISTQKNDNMKFIAQLLGLPEDATEAQITIAINALKQNLVTAENAAIAAAKARAATLITNAIGKKQLVEGDRAAFEPMAESNYEATEALINKIPAAKKPGDVINGKDKTVAGAGDDAAEAETWEALVKQGHEAVANCKKNDTAKYAALYKAHYGFEPNLDR